MSWMDDVELQFMLEDYGKDLYFVNKLFKKYQVFKFYNYIKYMFFIKNRYFSYLFDIEL